MQSLEVQIWPAEKTEPEMTFIDWIVSSSQQMVYVEGQTQVELCLEARTLGNQLRLNKVLKVGSGMMSS